MKHLNLPSSALILTVLAALMPMKAHGDTFVTLGGMAFTNSSEQGGQGPEGSTVLSQFELMNTWNWFGVGAFGQFDLQGSNETDIGYGPKIEVAIYDPFYIEAGYILSLNRSFDDRSIAEQTGYGWLGGIGVRFAMGGRGSRGGGGMFLQFSYKYRIHVVKEQDGIVLSQPIIQKDGYPLFGLGFKF